MFKTVLVAIAQFVVISLFAIGEPTTHAVNPKSGDGIYSLLRRYHLDEKCDIDQFLKINKLEKNSSIHTHKKYELPVYIYKYDGKSIRSTIGIKDWDQAVRIKNYNDKLKSKGLRNKTYAESKILWVPYHELHCKDAVKTDITTSTNSNTKVNTSKIIKNTNDLFGEKYKNFKIEDQSLKNEVYYVISGHGGPDPGARCLKCPTNNGSTKATLCEDEYAYDIALRLARNLMQHGATVHVIVEDSNMAKPYH